MKQHPLIVVMLALMILLSGCNTALDAPSAAAKQFMDTIASGGSPDSLYCPDAPMGGGLGSNLKEELEELRKLMTQNNVAFDVSGLKYQTLNQTSDTADVQLSGEYKVIAGGNPVQTDASNGVFKMKLEGGSWKVCGAGDEGFLSGSTIP